ncbi:hypothetical protein M9Y10_016554 [Tritrichomonas musculus]|uniref:Uncharacterized protein n=1 Tax=Tritrichomonas musculus TaxID=1915356 RepID=A0ABR2HWJ2_9EUKA
MFLKSRVLKNDLTQKIQENDDYPLEKILLHKDLSNTIRNESDTLYDRIFLKNWFEEIINYALFDKPPPEEYEKDNGIKQINHNASNFLENCGRKFMKLLKLDMDKKDPKYLINCVSRFISSDETSVNTDRMYAGHFQRFIENFFRWDAFSGHQDDLIVELIPFLIKKCRILAYQQLLTRIISDFSTKLGGDICYPIISKMLYHSYLAVKFIRIQLDESADYSTNLLSQSAIFNNLSQLRKEGIDKIDMQPLNLGKKPIPLLDLIFDDNNDLVQNEDDNAEIKINWKPGTVPDNEQIPHYENTEDAEMEAYLLIMSIRMSLYDLTEIIDYFRNDEENKYSLIEALFYCGTRCDVKSIISLEAFRLLDIIFNGSVGMSIEPWKTLEEDKMDLPFYPKYADNFVFDPSNLTYKMIHALPIFWNHRYNITGKNKYKMTLLEKKGNNVSDYYADLEGIDLKNQTRGRQEGETAVEILQPCLLCEPPISSTLIYTVTNIFIQLSKERKKLNEDENQTKEKRDRMLTIDCILYDFYGHHFDFENKENVRIVDLINDIVPLPSTDLYYYEDEEKPRRVPLNGFVFDFFLRLNNSEKINVFFEIGHKVIFSAMTHSQVMNDISTFTKTIMQLDNSLNYDLLPEYILYNIPIHSDFYFGDDEDEDNQPNKDQEPKKKRKMVIVDELSLVKKKKKKKKKPHAITPQVDKEESDKSERSDDQDQSNSQYAQNNQDSPNSQNWINNQNMTNDQNLPNNQNMTNDQNLPNNQNMTNDQNLSNNQNEL